MSIAIIGGSGFGQLAKLADAKPRDVAGPWGTPSALPLAGTFAGREVLFLPRHGPGHALPPHRINYRANIDALHRCGARSIIAINAVGGISRDMYPGRLAVPDQIIDYTSGRDHTFHDGGSSGVRHVDFSKPYSESLRRKLIASAENLRLQAHAGGTYGATQGPRLETAAEIHRMERDGCDLVGMTGMPEAALARELGIGFAAVCLVVNWAAGKSDDEITMEAIEQNLADGMHKILLLLEAVVPQL